MGMQMRNRDHKTSPHRNSNSATDVGACHHREKALRIPEGFSIVAIAREVCR